MTVLWQEKDCSWCNTRQIIRPRRIVERVLLRWEKMTMSLCGNAFIGVMDYATL